MDMMEPNAVFPCPLPLPPLLPSVLAVLLLQAVCTTLASGHADIGHFPQRQPISCMTEDNGLRKDQVGHICNKSCTLD